MFLSSLEYLSCVYHVSNENNLMENSKRLHLKNKASTSLFSVPYEHSRGRRKWEEFREEHGNIYIAICKIDSKQEFAV